MIETAVQRIESVRPKVSSKLEATRRMALGQFMTPASVARYMASLFSIPAQGVIRLLDPGAGLGALSAAFIQRWQRRRDTKASLDLVAYEVDGELRAHLGDHLAICQADAVAQKRECGVKVLSDDFIEASANHLEYDVRPVFTHAILNPPYKKISSDSTHKKWLRVSGIETVNMYSAFVALSLQLLVKDGELVAIIPRSFCNGPYYKSFRKFILRVAALDHIHLFGSRDKAFKDDNVLQENVIIKLVRAKHQGPVTVSHCTDGEFDDYREGLCEFDEIVKGDDAEQFIHIPAVSGGCISSVPVKKFHGALMDIGVSISTGPVVDFRLKSHLRKMPESGTVPLLYPCHVAEGRVSWPLEKSKKSNALVVDDQTSRWLYPAGCYTVVRRFSAKEEKRRVMAAVVRAEDFGACDKIAFENHLNVFHCCKQGIHEELAYGLCAYLNSTMVDRDFRAFNGHTQVNAADLRMLKYPDRSILMKLGRWVKKAGMVTQAQIDQHLLELV